MKNVLQAVLPFVTALLMTASCRGPGVHHRPAGPAPSPDSCLSASCHASILSRPLLHLPAAERNCSLCHELKRPGHPDGEGWEFARVMEKRPLVCLGCHLPYRDKPVFNHKPSRMGHCLECHEAHGSELPALVKRDVAGLCLYCHRNLAARLERVSTRHPALEETCVTTCHAPHRSENRRLLLQPEEVICVSCHEAAEECLPGTGNWGSSPSATCTGCHYAHGSILPKMLKRNSLLPRKRRERESGRTE